MTKTYSQFHDGFLDGIWISDETTVHVFLRTPGNGRVVIVGRGLAKLNSGDIRAGNIILDVNIREGEKITASDITEVYDVEPDYKSEWQNQMLKQAQAGLKLLEVNPSYGGYCLILASSFDFVDWNLSAIPWLTD